MSYYNYDISLCINIAAILLLLASVLTAKEIQTKPSTASKSASQKTTSKIPHGKREAPASYGAPMEFIAPTISGFTYGAPQPLFNVPHYSGYKYYSSPYKFTQPTLFTPANPHGFNSFADTPVKYSISSKELSELLKALHSPNPAVTIKAVPTEGSWDNSFGYDSFAHFKPAMLASYGIPPTSPVNTYLPPSYGPAPSAYQEPNYAPGNKGFRHYASSGNSHIPDIYSGNKYISSIKPLTVHAPAQPVSQLHTSIHTPKPFKPSTYLGSSNEASDYIHSQPATSSSFHNTFLAPSLQYLPPPKVQNKITYEQPSKSYLPPSAPPKPAGGYLPPKPSNTYLPAGQSNHNYIPLASHENGKHGLTFNHHSHETSNESYESYGGSASASVVSSTAKPHHPWQP
ncbi:uncharacterized protein LOC128739617 [Sabethes cyaneus]|uniref:uncharacterized protein LOC128739617 n=1 Tax=Sabethes cyaneus TaxID=53552 RepID=UPI00237E17F4|nr:uncharacterized protein LOC128739617 [Sabethes cyaneus]